jgi:uncharacterized membrane protein
MKLNDLIRYPEKIPCDKRLHALVGVVFTSILLSLGVALMPVFLMLITFGIGIELYQKNTNAGTFDIFDALATIIGGAFVMLSLL